MPSLAAGSRTTWCPTRAALRHLLRTRIDDEPSAVRPLGRHAQVRGEQFRRRTTVLRHQRSFHAVTYPTQYADNQTVAVGDRRELAQDTAHPSEEVLAMRHVEGRDGFQAKSYLAKTFHRGAKTLPVQNECLHEDR